MENNVVLQVNNLVKKYGNNRGVDGISFSVKKGEIFGLIGPNGAGKSTTIKSILGIVKKTSGEIKVNGLSIDENEKEIKGHIGYLPSECNFYNNMTVKKLLNYSQKLYGTFNISIDEYGKRLNLDLEKKIEDLSYGNKKKVGIIDTILSNGELIILDEATGGLDPLVQEEFFKIIEELRQHGKTIVYSAHVLTEIQRLCHRVGIIKEGKMIKVEDINNVNKINLKRVTLISNDIDLEKIKGISDYNKDNNRITFTYSGNPSELIRHLSKIDIKDIKIEEPSLEEIFLKYYER